MASNAQSLISYTLLLLIMMILPQISIQKPQSSKQKRMVELISRRLLEERDSGRFDGDENAFMKHKFKVMMESLPAEVKAKAMKELLYMFDLPEPIMEPRKPNSGPSPQVKTPPKYMIDLYNTIADRNGVTRTPGLLDADTVRSIPNIEKKCPQKCFFDLHPVDRSESIIDAELHIFQDRPLFENTKFKPSSYFIKIYQLRSKKSPSGGKLKKTLVAARRLPSHVYGWQIFPLLTTVESWNSDRENNLGILIETTSRHGPVTTTRSAAKWKQPILVVFSNNTDDAIGGANRKTKNLDFLHHARLLDDSMERILTNQVARSRQKRASGKRSKEKQAEESKKKQQEKKPSTEKDNDEFTMYGDAPKTEWSLDYASDGEAPVSGSNFPSFSTLSTEASASRSCRRYPLYVDFEEMGWSGWIIHPQGYNAYHCRGKCAFPLGENLKPSNHATVQSIMHTLGLGGQPVDMPCCTPGQLYDINLLYFDHNDYVVLRRYKDMVAASCACR